MLLRRTVQNISFLPTSSADFCIVYATRWSLMMLLKVRLVHFCGPPSIFEFYIHIYRQARITMRVFHVVRLNVS